MKRIKWFIPHTTLLSLHAVNTNLNLLSEIEHNLINCAYLTMTRQCLVKNSHSGRDAFNYTVYSIARDSKLILFSLLGLRLFSIGLLHTRRQTDEEGEFFFRYKRVQVSSPPFYNWNYLEATRVQVIAHKDTFCAQWAFWFARVASSQLTTK